ncbi:hypothetical protein QQS21_005741 [Conoideocrella luteorostrata]|uniref:AT hook domain-containing protein n=1 Tax=Conoideocrella luteorostrata TaxID=1105319 RepID=A0AAJ0CT47_9HYPO|nr:hypothetical protein QQS21_005741 [Conoideocrella luteorostrata]
MAPRIIADSDGDESEAEYTAPNPLPTCTQSDFQYHPQASSEDTNHPSTSTDPNFFRCVFDEQQDAARQEAKDQSVIEIPEDCDATDAPSFDKGFERTDNIRTMRSPWDVPNSPETAITKRSTKTDRLCKQTTRTKITRGLRRQLDDIGYVSQEDEPHTPNTKQNTRKRRRIRGNTDLGSDDDRMCTLPVVNDTSFLVAPTALTSSQMEQYSTIKVGVHNSPTQPVQQCGINVKSSGTTTNLNTPRSTRTRLLELPSSELPRSSQCQIIDLTEEDSKVTTTRAEDDYIPEVLKRDQELAFEVEPSASIETKKQRGRPRKVAAVTRVKGDMAVEATPKKKRGRPKKAEMVIKKDDEAAENEDACDSDSLEHPEKSDMQQETGMKEDMGITQDTATTPAANEAPQVITKPVLEIMKPGADNSGVLETKNPALKKPVSAASYSWRQPHRVGLSKNTRIASLLKVIRK